MENEEDLNLGNITRVTQFILLCCSHLAQLQLLLSVVVLLVFTVTMMGNILIVLIATVYPALHTPMYYFLKHWSLIEICYSLDIVPKMLINLLSERNTSSFTACALQLNSIILFIMSECFLLAIMACDWYVTTCHPLHYAIIMTKKTCRQMSAVAWLSGFPVAAGLAGWLFSMLFCKSKSTISSVTSHLYWNWCAQVPTYSSFWCSLPLCLSRCCHLLHLHHRIRES